MRRSSTAPPRCAATQWRNSPSRMKSQRILRKEFPRVLQYLRRGRTIYIVDCRSRLYGTKTRHVRTTASAALQLHSEIREKLRAAAKPIAESGLNPNLNAALTKLAANGGNLQQAVDLWIERNALELQQSRQPNVNCLCQEWMAYKLDNTLNSISQKTANEVRSYGNFICRTWGEKQIDSITENDIESILEQLKCKNITKRQYLRYITMFLRWVIERKRLISEIPTKHIRIKVAETIIHIYSPQQIQMMYQLVVNHFPELKSWFLICTWAGCRPSETSRMLWEDISTETNQIHVNSEGKTGSRFVSVDSNLISALLYIYKTDTNHPLIPTGLERRLKMLRKLIKHKLDTEWIKDGLRHTCVSYYYSLHQSWDKVEYCFGHSVRTSKKYYQKAVPEQATESFWGALKLISNHTSGLL